MRRVDVKWFYDRGRVDGLPRAAVDVYVVLLRFDAMGSAYPAVSTLAEETSRSERTVRLGLRRLEAAGWVETHRRVRETSVYVPMLRRKADPDRRSGSDCPRSLSKEREGTAPKARPSRAEPERAGPGLAKTGPVSEPAGGPAATAGPPPDDGEVRWNELVAVMKARQAANGHESTTEARAGERETATGEHAADFGFEDRGGVADAPGERAVTVPDLRMRGHGDG